ncbi:hypothetical protein [Actinopolymorpha pittospori]|uniref:Uncharacterized protein n=1 Tax=Actinopolymorpha pittospori TaxID=648752 RepID=A0A927MQ84_9ACTN|nr:hypothetical protein [Actinopolymorpha pittospori]MBE1603218.1 hypothetical protein [Actinopolymorpha pittospori]
MRILQLYPVGEYEFISTVDEDDLELVGELDATSRTADWSPVEVRIFSEDDDTGAPLQRADFPWLGSWALVLRDRAIDLAGPVLAPFGEFLPLTCADAAVTCFNGLELIDALDESRSQIVRFPSSGRIMAIEKHGFRPEMIPERSVFKIPQEQLGPLFYTEPVVDDLRALGLTGLDFRLVWDSDGM